MTVQGRPIFLQARAAANPAFPPDDETENITCSTSSNFLPPIWCVNPLMKMQSEDALYSNKICLIYILLIKIRNKKV